MQLPLHPRTSSSSREMCGNGIPPLPPEGSQSIPWIPDSPGTRLCPQLPKKKNSRFYFWANDVAEAIPLISLRTDPTKALCARCLFPARPSLGFPAFCRSPTVNSRLQLSPVFHSCSRTNGWLSLNAHKPILDFKGYQLSHLRTRQ